jgi:lipoyl(octanoyl) transferase
LSYSVVYKDIGLKDYKETWDYQVAVFTELVTDKKKRLKGVDGKPPILPGTLIFVEHPHVYTLGKSGTENNLLVDPKHLVASGATFFRIDRGGDITYHGPGQIVGYPIFDLDLLKTGLREYINKLEEAIILTVGEFGIKASRLPDATGVWIDAENKVRARKICAIGVKASRYITMHGFALNVNTDLSFFNKINPCGFTDKGVTSMEAELGESQDLGIVKEAAKRNLQKVFDLEWTNN